MNNIYVHDLSPFALRFTDTFGIRWYGLAYLTGFVLGYLVIRAVVRRGNSPLKDAADFVTYVAVGVLVGGRLGYCLFYDPDLFTHFDSAFPFWGVLKVNEGGMASHGGILGVLIVCFWYAWKHNISPLHLMDLVVFGGTLGFFFGRIANFINGELYGREAPAGFAWAVKFPQEMYLWAETQVSKLNDIAPAAAALHTLHTPDHDIALDKAVWHGWVANYTQDIGSRNAVQLTIEQIIAAIQNGNEQVKAALAPALTARYPSQLFQSVLEGLLVFLILTIIWIKPKKPGALAGWFAILYSIARIIGEQFRMPDIGIGFQLWGLTRGQWLSIGLLVLGIVILVLASRRDVEPLGGFTRPERQDS